MNLRGRMARGAAWMVLAKLAHRVIAFVSIMILARLLMPADFGIVAMAMSFVALLELLNAFGFDVALIQRQRRDQAAFDTAWTFGVLLGCLVAGLMLLFAAPVARFYGVPGVEEAIRVLAIGSVLQGLQNIGVVTFRMDLQFDREFRFLVGSRLCGFLVTIPLALWLRSYWALVIGMTFGRLFTVGLSYWMHPYRPRASLAAAADLLGFSKWMLAVNCVTYLKERSSDWIVGLKAGPAALGIFNMSYEIASLPSTELAAPINRAVLPAYAQMAGDRSALRREFLLVMSLIALIAVPALFGLAAVAPLAVPLLLGPNWSDAVPVMFILCFFVLTHLVQSNAQSAYLAIGRPDIPAKLNGLQVIVQLAALWPLTTRYGLAGAATAFALTAAVMIPLSVAVVLRVLSLDLRTFLAAVWRSLVAGGLMLAAVAAWVGLDARPYDPRSLLVIFMLAAISGAAIYALLIALLWALSGRPEGAERILWTRSCNAVAYLCARLTGRQV